MFVEPPSGPRSSSVAAACPGILINTLLQQGEFATTTQHQLLQQFPSFEISNLKF